MKELKKIDVYLIAGQSNAVGCTNINTLPEGFKGEVFDRITLYHEGNFCPTYYGKLNKGVRLGMGCNEDHIGIEYGMAKYFQENTTNEIALIRYGYGGSNLYLDWQPRFLWKDEPSFISQYGFSYKIWAQTVVNGLNKLMEKGYLPEIKGLAWMQGESDADKTEEIANNYYDNLCDLIFSMRTELRIPDLPVAIGEISTQTNIAPWADIVRKNQLKFTENDENSILVSTKDIPAGKDGLHYDGIEDIKLGMRFAEKLFSLNKESF